MIKKENLKVIDIYDSDYDFFAFSIPLLAALGLMFFFHDSMIDDRNLFHLIILKAGVNHLHVFFTLFLALEQKKIANFLAVNRWPVIVVCGLLPLVGFISLKYFKIILGYFGLFHVVMQLYGLIRITNKKSEDKIGSYISLGLFSTIIFTSLMHWFQGRSTVKLSYFFFKNLILLPDIFPTETGSWMISILAFLFIANSLKNYYLYRVINMGQIYVLLSCWIIFYFGLVMARSNNLFYSLSLMFHGVNYMIHVIYAKKKVSNGVFAGNYKNIQIMLAGSAMWTVSLKLFSHVVWMIPLLYAPLIMHFIFDGYFWKKNRFVQYS